MAPSPEQSAASLPVPTQVALQPGGSVELALPSLAPAGYLWEAVADGPSDIVALDWQRRPAPPDQGIGAGGTEVLTVTAQRPGRLVVRLTQRRPWEQGRPALTTYQVEVAVAGETGTEVDGSDPGRTAGPGPD